MPRALEAWPYIDLRDDREGGLFLATVRRKALAAGDVVVHDGTQKTTQKLLGLISQDRSVTRQALAEALGITADGEDDDVLRRPPGETREVGQFGPCVGMIPRAVSRHATFSSLPPFL